MCFSRNVGGYDFDKHRVWLNFLVYSPFSQNHRIFYLLMQSGILCRLMPTSNRKFWTKITNQDHVHTSANPWNRWVSLMHIVYVVKEARTLFEFTFLYLHHVEEAFLHWNNSREKFKMTRRRLTAKSVDLWREVESNFNQVFRCFPAPPTQLIVLSMKSLWSYITCFKRNGYVKFILVNIRFHITITKFLYV